jgi:hypothetical protein
MQRARHAFAADEELASDEQVIARALAIDPNILPPDDMLRRMIEAVAYAESRRDADLEMANAVKARSDRWAARAMVLRSELLDMMLAMERRSFAGSPFRTATVREGVASLFVQDEEAIPDKYKITTVVRRTDRIGLLADLKAGVVVSGALLTNGPPVLQLRGGKARVTEEAA